MACRNSRVGSLRRGFARRCQLAVHAAVTKHSTREYVAASSRSLPLVPLAPTFGRPPLREAAAFARSSLALRIIARASLILSYASRRSEVANLVVAGQPVDDASRMTVMKQDFADSTNAIHTVRSDGQWGLLLMLESYSYHQIQ